MTSTFQIMFSEKKQKKKKKRDYELPSFGLVIFTIEKYNIHVHRYRLGNEQYMNEHRQYV